MCGRPMAFRENYSREMHSRKENFFPQLASGKYAILLLWSAKDQV